LNQGFELGSKTREVKSLFVLCLWRCCYCADQPVNLGLSIATAIEVDDLKTTERGGRIDLEIRNLVPGAVVRCMTRENRSRTEIRAEKDDKQQPVVGGIDATLLEPSNHD
jgi:hypothetical protein